MVGNRKTCKGKGKGKGRKKVHYGLPYNPKKWNSDLYLKRSHNCYTYFLNKTQKKAVERCKKIPLRKKCKKPQPGFYAGYPRIKNKRKYTCKNMNNRVLADNKHITTTSFSKKCPKGYYMGALAVNPGKTYHFYRQDDDGYWSHKNGKYKATRYDASGKLIKNPKQADRIYKRRMHRYPDFCNFYCIPKADDMKNMKLLSRTRTRTVRRTNEKKHHNTTRKHS